MFDQPRTETRDPETAHGDGCQLRASGARDLQATGEFAQVPTRQLVPTGADCFCNESPDSEARRKKVRERCGTEGGQQVKVL